MKQLFLVVLLAIIFGALPATAGTTKGDSCTNCKPCADMCASKLKDLKANKSADPKLVSVMTDCVSICKVRDDFRQRKSPFRAKVYGVCADVCSKCAQACADSKDPKLQACAETCRKCSTSCEGGG